MDREKQVEKFRVLWEQIMVGNKLVVCTEDLKGTGILDVNILRLLFNNPEIIPKEIAGKLSIPNSTLTNAINRLEKRGLVERKLNANDLRSLQLLLSDKGKRAICKHHDAERTLIEHIFNILSEDESSALINMFEKIIEKL